MTVQESIRTEFKTGSQPITPIEFEGFPRQPALDFIVSIEGGKTANKIGGGLYYTVEEDDGWVYDQRYVALFE